jgi:hypothetical protein
MLAQTYKAEDVSPNEIQKTFDNTIDKSSNESNVKFSGSATGGILGGLATAGASVSGEVFQKNMADKEVTAEFDGHKWVAKKVDIQRINISRFAQDWGGTISDVSVTAASPYSVEQRQLRFIGVQSLQSPKPSGE